jgi:hypothetical protein
LQAAWYSLPHLRHFDVCYIGTPVSRRQLDRVLSRLPALEFVRLHFRTIKRWGLKYGTDSDSDDAPGARQLRKLVKHNKFPPNLLRWVPPVHMWHVSGRPAASFTEPCFLYSLVVMSLVTHSCFGTLPTPVGIGRTNIRPMPEIVVCRCTHLTHLELGMHDLDTPQDMFSVGGLPDGITALQRLQHLRLDNCVTAPLTQSISGLTQLTCLEITQDELCGWEAYTPHEVMVR